MKRMICLITALLLCMMVTVPAFAAEDDFVPSIEIKDSPDVEDAVIGGEDVTSNMIITSVLQAQEKSTNITQEERDALLDLYQALRNDEVELPFKDEDLVVRELVDISFTSEELENQTVTVTLDLGVQGATDVSVFTYVNGEWIPAAKVVNNGNGTVTVTLDKLGIVAFCVDADAEALPPATGDLAMGDVALWGGLMLLSGVMLVCVVLLRRKNAEN